MIYMIKVPVWVLGMLMATASTSDADTDVMPATRVFGQLPDGRVVTEYTLTSTSGLRARILDFGGIVRELLVPDRRGDLSSGRLFAAGIAVSLLRQCRPPALAEHCFSCCCGLAAD